ncbi:MAG: hypothetical protein KAS32_13715 [Candidatus Peribacteraceae bacterium]|nr:hypothetical protein [Candidatus Peribacteraceae bacterium]
MAEKTLEDCVDDAYRALKMAHDKFIADKEYWGGNHHFEWESSVGIAGLIAFNKQYMKYGTYTPLDIPKSEPKESSSNTTQSPSASTNMVTVHLTDGSMKTKDANLKYRLGTLGWHWNMPVGSYDWHRDLDEADWKALKKEEPFCNLKATIVRG